MSNMKRLWEDYFGDEPYDDAEKMMREAGMTKETKEKIEKWLEKKYKDGKDD